MNVTIMCKKCGKPLGMFDGQICVECQKSSEDMPCITPEEMQKCKDIVKKYTPKKEPCEDAISRDAVIKTINNNTADERDGWLCIDNDLVHEIEHLPSVTQKSGKWIRVTDKAGHLVWECDKCSWQQRFNTNFCPDCGARMEGMEYEKGYIL